MLFFVVLVDFKAPKTTIHQPVRNTHGRGYTDHNSKIRTTGRVGLGSSPVGVVIKGVVRTESADKAQTRDHSY